MPLGDAPKTKIDIDFTRAQGIAAVGRITFQPPRVRIGTTMLSTRKVTARVTGGRGEIDLVRLPSGTYTVREEIDGRPVVEFDISLPLGAAAEVQYELLAPVDPVPIVYTVVRSINGVLPNPTTGDVPLDDLEGASDLSDLDDVEIGVLLDNQVLWYDEATEKWINKILSAVDVGAADENHTHTPSQVGAAPAVHTHTPSEAGAAPASHTHPPATIEELQPELGTLVDLLIESAVEDLTKASVGLDQVDNTSDLDKPISTAVQEALDNLPDPPASAPPDRIQIIRDRSKQGSGDYYALPSTGSSWVVPDTLPQYSIQASVGDHIEVSYNYLIGQDAPTVFTDFAVVTGPFPHTVRRYLVSGDLTTTWQGSSGDYPSSDGFQGRRGTFGFFVTSDDLDSGFVRLRWAIKSSTGDGRLYANNNYPTVISIRNTRLSGV